MHVVERFDQWHQTKVGRLIISLVEAVGAYSIISLAIDSGHWWQYLLGSIFVVGALANIVSLGRALIRSTK